MAEILEEKEFEQKWESLGISNDFIFGKVMQDKGLLKELLQMILPELKIGEIEVITQKTIEDGLDTHGIRLDVYASDDGGTVYEVEMQVVLFKHLPKRARYYSSLIDTQMLEKRVPYSRLKDSYVIFICLEDLFGKGRHKYTFQYFCLEEKKIGLGDGTAIIFLNAAGTKDDTGSGLKTFLNYVAGQVSDDPYVQKVERAVALAKKNKEWRREYKMLEAIQAQWELDMKEKITEEITKKVTEEITKKVTGEITQKVTGEITEEVIERRDKEIIEKMLRKGKTPEEISSFCDYPLEQVLKVQKALETELAVH